MARIRHLHAIEILDSRGRPTIKCYCRLASGIVGACSVPSGASTGWHEARELRDNDPRRHRGLGCLRAIGHIKGEIRARLLDTEWHTQRELDECLIALDGTASKARLGANALLAVSLSFARAAAAEQNQPLYAYFNAMLPAFLQGPVSMPQPTINLFSGGLHAGGQVALQDALIVPLPGRDIQSQMQAMCEAHAVAIELTQAKYGMRNLTADEGGLAPPFPSAQAMLDDVMTCAQRAGLTPERDFHIAIDAAASHFRENGRYLLDGQLRDQEQMIQIYEEWASDYPLYSLEDGLAEDDWTGWQKMQARLKGRTWILGDDLLCTHPSRIAQAADMSAADALLLKVNQIGTLTEALQALQLARRHDWHVVVSARSGETEDDWLADLAVGWRADSIKVGSITQSERLAKYNRLLEIADQLSS